MREYATYARYNGTYQHIRDELFEQLVRIYSNRLFRQLTECPERVGDDESEAFVDENAHLMLLHYTWGVYNSYYRVEEDSRLPRGLDPTVHGPAVRKYLRGQLHLRHREILVALAGEAVTAQWYTHLNQFVSKSLSAAPHSDDLKNCSSEEWKSARGPENVDGPSLATDEFAVVLEAVADATIIHAYLGKNEVFLRGLHDFLRVAKSQIPCVRDPELAMGVYERLQLDLGKQASETFMFAAESARKIDSVVAEQETYHARVQATKKKGRRMGKKKKS